MAIENEFLPMLNSWPLLIVVVTLMLVYCFVEFVVPHIKEWREAREHEKQK